MATVSKRLQKVMPVVALLVIGLILMGCSPASKKDAAAAPPQPVVFHLNHFMPAMHPVNVNLLEPLAKEVKEKTQGRVEIVIHPGNGLAAPADTYDAVVSGVAGMGFVLPAYTPGRFPLSQILEYPFMFTSALQANLTAKEMTPMLRQFEYTDTHLLWFGGTDLGDFLMKANVRTLSEMQGKKLRSPGPIYNDVIAAIKGVQVSLPVSDLYDSMDRGIVDGTVMAPSALISFRLMEVTNTIVQLDMYTTPLIFFANKELWNKVSQADQKIIMDIVDTFPERAGKQYDAEVKHAMSLARERNKNIIRFTDAEMVQFHALTDPLVKGWIAKLEASGKPGQRLYDLAVEAARKYKQ
jgi:TRAP-type C4-dicarboxylate transport system substrate-binding protein